MNEILLAANRIKNYIKNTPVISDQKLNEELGAQIFFKMENQQETNSFKARGAFNAILSYKEKHGKFPEKIVAQSSGNHGQGIALPLGNQDKDTEIEKYSNLVTKIIISATKDPY